MATTTNNYFLARSMPTSTALMQTQLKVVRRLLCDHFRQKDEHISSTRGRNRKDIYFERRVRHPMKRDAQPINTRGDGKQRVDLLFEPRFLFYFSVTGKKVRKREQKDISRVFIRLHCPFFLVSALTETTCPPPSATRKCYLFLG